MMGVYYASCAQIDSEVVLTSIPAGLLVMNILFTLLVLPRGIWLYRSLVNFSKGVNVDIERPAFWLVVTAAPYKNDVRYNID